MSTTHPKTLRPKLRFSLVSTLAGSLLLAQVARPADPPGTNDITRLPMVTVTAQKESQPLQSAPVSVTPVTRSVLEDSGARYVNDAAMYAPNTFITEFSARKLSNPRFRGIGSSPANPGVTTFIDGVPQLNANSSSLELLDVDQIEFVRGPQAALFGRNTVGGLINITSSRPSLKDWTGGLTSGYGSYNMRDVRATASAPLITDQLALGVGIGYSQRDGYTKNTVTGHDLDSRAASFGKGQLLWMPWENWDVRLILTGERARDGDYALNDLAKLRAAPHTASRDFEGFTHRDIFAPTLLVNHNGPTTDFSMITGLVWWKTRDLTDLDYTAAPLITRDNKEKDFQFTEELRLASAKDKPVELSDNLQLKWQTGVSFFTQNYKQDAVNNYSFGVLYQPGSFGGGFPPGFSPANSQHSPMSKLDDMGFGAYAQGTLTAWEKLDAGISLRGDYENKKANLNTFFVTPDPFLGPATVRNLHMDFADVSPQFSLAYHFTPEKMIYAVAARGYKAGGFNPTSPAGSSGFGVEHSWNYEAGAKTSWLDDRLAVNVAAFYSDWNNLQLNVPSGGGAFFIKNVGGAYIKGLELEVTARPARGWDIFAGVGVQDGKFAGGTMDLNSLTGLSQNVGGNRLPYTPDFTVNGGAQISYPVCSKLTAFARAEVVAYGSFKYDSVNGAGQSAYSLANFRAGFRGKNWSLEGWARNAFDSKYVPIAFQYPGLAPSGYLGESGAPVTFGVTADIHF